MKKRLFSRILSLLLICTMLAACGSSQESAMPETTPEEALENNFTIPTFDPKDYIKIATTTTQTIPATAAKGLPIEELALVDCGSGNATNILGNIAFPVRYVMIYNPSMYTAYVGLTTGNISNQITVDVNKSGEDTSDPIDNLTMSQEELNADIDLGGLIQDGSRAGSIITPYKTGDTKTFYCYDDISTSNPRISRKFTCKYAGTYCNIWVSGTNMSSSRIKEYGNEFDTYIYEKVVKAFGQPRFSNNGGKVNLLYYPMPNNIGGCFCMYDLFARDEVTSQEISAYGINVDHDILHINATLTEYSSLDTYMRSTMAHEFQHLICATNVFETPYFTNCPVWINEAMSGYIEETLYPGVKEGSSGHLSSFSKSYLIRNGQSLYNFTTYSDDIGVYGSVYLFSEFLSKVAGNDIFSKFHRYWRYSYSSSLSAAEAISRSIPRDVCQAIDAYTPYPSSLNFASEDHRLLSKLTLQFHLELLNKEKDDPAAFAKIKSQTLLYNQLNSARIEGGGRIIVALQGDTFTIPKDADRGLFYIGLDKDFNPVTALHYR